MVGEINPSHMSLDKDTYDRYVNQAYEFTKDGVDFDKLDPFLKSSMDMLGKVQEPASREAIWLRVSEVYGFVANEAVFNSDRYQEIKNHIQSYTESIFLSQNSKARTDWEKQDGGTPTTGTNVSEVWLISILA
jgi:hypothetical protein